MDIEKNRSSVQKRRKVAAFLAVASLLCLGSAFAASTLGSMAKNITATFGDIGKMITAASYIAGLGFGVGAIMKFKQHKDNPTQIQIGQPLGLVVIAAALLFLPTMFKSIGATMFGTASTAGPSGTTLTGT